MTKKELWIRIKCYHFNHIVPAGLWGHVKELFGGDGSSSRAFAAKIARKHNWPGRMALKAVFEYKKFVYLGVVSDFEVTPSKAIDIVWHEHILFTKGYRDFCNSVIECPFDHNPELVPIQDQTGRFSAQFIDTLNLYKNEFGIIPPEDIWGVAKFDDEIVKYGKYQSRKKSRGDGSNGGYGDGTLVDSFDGSISDSSTFPEFNDFGDGDFGGAGVDGGWGDSDGGSSDGGGDGGGDGGSSCSGGCGGGCGGGD
ncbi:MAG: hypothetical protein V4722_05960 [Bacteroidota bacterium]